MTYRLLKVVCQTVLVSEDADGNLQEHVAQSVHVSAADWPDYPAKLVRDIKELDQF